MQSVYEGQEYIEVEATIGPVPIVNPGIEGEMTQIPVVRLPY